MSLTELEERIWGRISEEYANNRREVASFQRRLIRYPWETELVQLGIKTGLERLCCEGIRQDVEEEVKIRFDTYKKLVSRGPPKLYKRHSDEFLEESVIEVRNSLQMYLGLLDIVHPEHPLYKVGVEFVDHVKVLVVIYHNLEIEQDIFGRRMSHQRYNEALENIRKNREALANIKSESHEIRNCVRYLKNLSYSANATILFEFVNHLSLKQDEIQKQGVMLEELENTRIMILEQLKESRKFGGLGPELEEFYIRNQTVMDVIYHPKIDIITSKILP